VPFKVQVTTGEFNNRVVSYNNSKIIYNYLTTTQKTATLSFIQNGLFVPSAHRFSELEI